MQGRLLNKILILKTGNTVNSLRAAGEDFEQWFMDGSGLPDGNPLYSQALWEGLGGLNNFAAEVNVAGNFTYGFVWDLKSEVLPADITTGKTGTWRITFSLDPTSPVMTTNHTIIDSVANGQLDAMNNQAYIDIQIQ